MSLRKKLVLSNILMILIPVCIAVFLCGFVYSYGGQYYWKSLENMFEGDYGLYTAQGIIYDNKDDMMEYRPEADHKNKRDESKSLKVFRDLIQEISAIGYHYQISCNDEVLLENLNEADRETIERLAGKNHEAADSISLSDANGAVAKNTFFDMDKKIEVTTVSSGGAMNIGKNNSIVFRYFIRLILLFASIIVISIILTNYLLSRWMARSIAEPLMQLAKGAKEIQDGNLNYQIAYRKSNELGQVCQEFNNMAAYLKESVEERTRYETYRKELIAGISHDLRTPLTSIKGYTEGLLDGLADTQEKQQRYYEAIHTRTGDMEALLENLALFSKLENYKFEYQFERIHMAEYLHSYFTEHAQEMEEQRVIIGLDLEKGKDAVIKGDKKELRRIFNNLIQNAVKYRSQEVSCIDIFLKQQGKQLVVVIKDDGPGVREKDIDFIFNSFYRSDESRAAPMKGNGLGLSIVKSIIEGHGGTIRAENENGLKLIITFPCFEEEEYVSNLNY